MKPLPQSPRIVVRGVNWLGDAVMTTPALMRLREAFPKAHIALLTQAKLGDLWKNQPFLDAVLVIPPKQSPWKTAAMLRLGNFDAGLIFPNSIRSALEFRLAGIARRIGYSRDWRTFLLTDAVKPRVESVKMQKRSAAEVQQLISSNASSGNLVPVTAHQVHEYLTLTSAMGGNPTPLPPKIVVTQDELDQGRDRFGINPEDGQRPWFGLNPGAEYGPAKRWPAEFFVKTAVELSERTQCRWVIFGGPGDMELAREIETKIQSASGTARAVTLNLAGKTTLRQLAAALRLCRLLITNDTGPMHLASAVGTPVIVPFGSTSPELTGPIFASNARIIKTALPCSPCFQRTCPIEYRCLQGITPERMVQETLDLVKAFELAEIKPGV